jgi:hypothetical protein
VFLRFVVSVQVLLKQGQHFINKLLCGDWEIQHQRAKGHADGFLFITLLACSSAFLGVRNFPDLASCPSVTSTLDRFCLSHLALTAG